MTEPANRIVEAAADIVVLAGCASVAYGAWLVLPAAGFIVGGIEAAVLGLMLSIRIRA